MARLLKAGTIFRLEVHTFPSHTCGPSVVQIDEHTVDSKLGGGCKHRKKATLPRELAVTLNLTSSPMSVRKTKLSSDREAAALKLCLSS